MSSIPGLAAASAIQQTTVANEIAYAAAAKRQDALQAEGEAAVALLEAAVNLSKSADCGECLDLQA